MEQDENLPSNENVEIEGAKNKSSSDEPIDEAHAIAAQFGARGGVGVAVAGLDPMSSMHMQGGIPPMMGGDPMMMMNMMQQQQQQQQQQLQQQQLLQQQGPPGRGKDAVKPGMVVRP